MKLCKLCEEVEVKNSDCCNACNEELYWEEYYDEIQEEAMKSLFEDYERGYWSPVKTEKYIGYGLDLSEEEAKKHFKKIIED